MTGRCPACSTGFDAPFARLANVPALCNALWPSADEARSAALGDVELCLCSTCGLISNRLFDPAAAAYSPQYENSLHFSGQFRSFATELARSLTERHGLAGKEVLEIGPGSGDFLTMLIDAGVGHAVGFDPSHDPDRALPGLADRAEIQARHYPTDREVDAAMVVCRHVLEHVTEPRALLAAISGSVAPGAQVPVYIEVPDADYMLEHPAIWDVIFEHHTYFSERSLRWLAESVGLKVTDAGRCFGDQYLWLEAVADGSGPADLAPVAGLPVALAAGFGDLLASTLTKWDDWVGAAAAEGPVALWGAGSKGVTFLNAIGRAKSIDFVIDLNPRKHGLFVPGTGQCVAGPEVLTSHPTASVLVMNPVYEAEIATQLASMGWRGRLAVV